MILYVESNFILELAYLQEEHENCERILALAEAGTIRLIIPAFAMAEPYSVWVGRKNLRNDLHGSLTRELSQLRRSQPYVDSLREFQEVTKILLLSGEEEKLRLDATIERVLAVASVIPLTADTIRGAVQIQKSRKLKPQDSIVYASILSELRGAEDAPRCFVTKDSDFADPDIRQELAGHQCDFAPNFGSAYGLVLKNTNPP